MKADPETVLNGLIRREENLKENESIAGFASWNQGVTRNYNHKTKLYESLPKLNALINVKKLIEINEKEYEKYASYTFESAQLFDWHKNYHEETKLNLINLIVKNAG
ncbi:MAG: hypothetical protein IPJ74_11635 [Saprospiraceae bacterium]|nr:hypothetical protein [Saprospiraceae bacterium]